MDDVVAKLDLLRKIREDGENYLFPFRNRLPSDQEILDYLEGKSLEIKCDRFDLIIKDINEMNVINTYREKRLNSIEKVEKIITTHLNNVSKEIDKILQESEKESKLMNVLADSSDVKKKMIAELKKNKKFIKIKPSS